MTFQLSIPPDSSPVVFMEHTAERGGGAGDDGKREGEKTTGKSFFQDGGPINGGR